jgi:hypothetical protein
MANRRRNLRQAYFFTVLMSCFIGLNLFPGFYGRMVLFLIVSFSYIPIKSAGLDVSSEYLRRKKVGEKIRL